MIRGDFFMPIVNTQVPITSKLTEQYLQQIAEKYPFTRLEKVGTTDYQRPLWMLFSFLVVRAKRAPNSTNATLAKASPTSDFFILSSLSKTLVHTF